MSSQNNKSPIKFVFQCTKGLRHYLAATFFFVTMSIIVGRYLFYLTAEIADAATSIIKDNDDFSILWNLIIIYGCALFVRNIIWRLSGFCGTQWITRTEAQINQTLFNYLSRHSVSYFYQRFAGSLANKISNVANGFSSLASNTSWNFFPLACGVIADLFLSFYVHYSLALILFVWIVIFLGANIKMGFWLKQFYYKSANANSKLKGKIIDSAGNISTVQTAPGTEYEQKYIGRYIKYLQNRRIKSLNNSEWLLLSNSILVGFFTISMLWASIYLFQLNLISLGSIILIITIIVNLERHLFFLADSISEALSNYGEMEEGLDDIFIAYEIDDQPHKQSLNLTHGKIHFQNLIFSYGNENIFDHLNFAVAAGEKIGLVGLSGAGKSTLVSLLMRQYDLQGGSILIDDQDISSVRLESLRKQIAYVPQSTELFHRTIFENIRYGNFKATQADIKTAAQLAFAADFIEKFPQKYQTYVGERGVKLSGGQRQRIAIARAFLKKAPILVLDEATSALDSESEAVIQEALKELMQNKTVIAIAHRLSTLQMMDRIIVIDQGCIVESGSHQDLLNQNGLYANIWNRQVSGFIQEELVPINSY